MGVWPAYMFVYYISAWYLQKPEDGIRSPGIGVSGGCKAPCGYRDSNPGSGRAASAFNNWAVCPAPSLTLAFRSMTCQFSKRPSDYQLKPTPQSLLGLSDSILIQETFWSFSMVITYFSPLNIDSTELIIPHTESRTVLIPIFAENLNSKIYYSLVVKPGRLWIKIISFN